MTEPDDQGGQFVTIHVPGEMTPQRMYLATTVAEAICFITTLESRLLDQSRPMHPLDIAAMTNELEDVTRAVDDLAFQGRVAEFKPGKSGKIISALSDLNLATSRVRLGEDFTYRDSPLVRFEWLQRTSSFAFKIGVDVDLAVITTIRENMGKTGRETRREELRRLKEANLQAEQLAEMEIHNKRMKMVEKTLRGWVKDGIISTDDSRRIWRALLAGDLSINNAASWLDFTIDPGTPPPPAIGPAAD